MVRKGLVVLVLMLMVRTFSACNSPLTTPKPIAPLVINVQPLGSMPQKLVQQMVDTLRKHYHHMQELPAIPLPKRAFYAERQRYRADSLIIFYNNKHQITAPQLVSHRLILVQTKALLKIGA